MSFIPKYFIACFLRTRAFSYITTVQYDIIVSTICRSYLDFSISVRSFIEEESPRSGITFIFQDFFCFEMVLQYFIVFHDGDNFEDGSPFWKMSLHLDSSVSLELDSGSAVVQDCYRSDVFILVHLMRRHIGSICLILGGVNVDHLVIGDVCLVVDYISWFF